ncbi:MAG: fatty acid desaturase [Pseudobdellovibrionaceae bacterium]
MRIGFHHRPILTPLILGLCAGGFAIGFYEGLSLWWLGAYVTHLFLFSFGIAFGLHRMVAHHAYNPPWFIQRLSVLVGVIAQGGSPMSWQTTHIMHHARSDVEGDPHSPARLGWRVIFGAADPVAKEFIIERALKERGLRDPYYLILHKYYYLVTAAYALAMFLLFGTNGLVYLAAIPIGLSILSLGLLNYFAHAGNEARNVWWLFPLTFGENWHGNHHLQPGAQYSGLTIFEIDLIGLVWRGSADLFAKQDIPEIRSP